MQRFREELKNALVRFTPEVIQNRLAFRLHLLDRLRRCQFLLHHPIDEGTDAQVFHRHGGVLRDPGVETAVLVGPVGYRFIRPLARMICASASSTPESSLDLLQDPQIGILGNLVRTGSHDETQHLSPLQILFSGKLKVEGFQSLIPELLFLAPPFTSFSFKLLAFRLGET